VEYKGGNDANRVPQHLDAPGRTVTRNLSNLGKFVNQQFIKIQLEHADLR
jgi:hypothetical protein